MWHHSTAAGHVVTIPPLNIYFFFAISYGEREGVAANLVARRNIYAVESLRRAPFPFSFLRRVRSCFALSVGLLFCSF